MFSRVKRNKHHIEQWSKKFSIYIISLKGKCWRAKDLSFVLKYNTF